LTSTTPRGRGRLRVADGDLPDDSLGVPRQRCVGADATAGADQGAGSDRREEDEERRATCFHALMEAKLPKTLLRCG
jgi:hypothetical protein